MSDAANLSKLLELLEKQQQALDNQAKLFELVTGRSSTDVKEGSEKGLEFLMDSLASTMAEFCFDPDHNLTFHMWFSRYEDVFRVDAAKLDDKAKVRLLMRKLNSLAYEKYASFILPKHSRDFTFEETTKTLTEIFDVQESLLSVRYKCLQTTKSASEDFVSYAATVNRNCENFKLSMLTPDQFKFLVFVLGLQSPSDADVRTRLLSKLENASEAEQVTLNKLVADAQRVINLKHDTRLIEQQDSKPVVSALQGTASHSRHIQKIKPVPKTPCWGCGDMHFAKECRYRYHKCIQCNKMGHKEGYCACFEKKASKGLTHQGEASKQPKYTREFKGKRRNKGQAPQSTAVFAKINKVNFSQRRKFVEIRINDIVGSPHVKDTQIRLQIDTASDISIISRATWTKLGKPGVCLENGIQARSASQHIIQIIAKFRCVAQLNGEVQSIILYVSNVNSLNILGIDLCDIFKLWDKPLSSIWCHQIKTLTNGKPAIAHIREQFAQLFKDQPGTCTKAMVNLRLKPNVSSVFRPKRPVSYAALPQIEKELDRLQELNVISPTDYSEWAAPIVVVRKATGCIRICGDYSTGLNDCLEPHQYPLPVPEDIFAKFSNSTIFSHIDLSDAYLQVPVDEQSRKLLTINTHKGLFTFNRLAPGIKTAPGAFQQIIDTLLAGIDGTAAYMDDIVVAGSNQHEHWNNLG